MSTKTIGINNVNQKSGSATVTVNVAEGTNYLAASKTVNVTTDFVKIYGVEWDGTATTTWTRTDDAVGFTDPVPAVNNGNGSSPFDNISPWKNMVKETRTGGVMVKIPKFYFKWTKSGNTMSLKIIPNEFSSYALANGYSVCPACMDRGDGKGERNYVYVGRYHCASDYKSKTGEQPNVNKAIYEFHNSIHSLGTNIWQWDYTILVTIWMLYLVEYADWNSQNKIGWGGGVDDNYRTTADNTGFTDSMIYHTGTNTGTRTQYGHVQYRNIEDLWANVDHYCDGVMFKDYAIYCFKDPSKIDYLYFYNKGTNVGTAARTSSSYISSWAFSSVSGFGWFLYPDAKNGSGTTYITDVCSNSNGNRVLTVGGNYHTYYHGDYYGLFCLSGGGSYSQGSGTTSSRIMELP